MKLNGGFNFIGFVWVTNLFELFQKGLENNIKENQSTIATITSCTYYIVYIYINQVLKIPLGCFGGGGTRINTHYFMFQISQLFSSE